MASYNVDKFKRFVFESEFLQRFKIDGETAEKLKNDEVELLKFAMNWLKSVLFQEKSFEEKDGSGKTRAE